MYAHGEKYLQNVKRKCTGQELDIKEPPNQKNRATSTFRLGKCNLTYILDLLNNGGIINSAIIIAVAQGTVTNFDSNLWVIKWWTHGPDILGKVLVSTLRICQEEIKYEGQDISLKFQSTTETVLL